MNIFASATGAGCTTGVGCGATGGELCTAGVSLGFSLGFSAFFIAAARAASVTLLT